MAWQKVARERLGLSLGLAHALRNPGGVVVTTVAR
jgi:hypothetical protein